MSAYHVMHAQNVINQFTRLGEDPRLTFLGNVSVGKDIPLERLRQHYHAVQSWSASIASDAASMLLARM